MVTADFNEQYPSNAYFDSSRLGSVTAANDPSALDTFTMTGAGRHGAAATWRA